jgi:hypothetical protein
MGYVTEWASEYFVRRDEIFATRHWQASLLAELEPHSFCRSEIEGVAWDLMRSEEEFE